MDRTAFNELVGSHRDSFAALSVGVYASGGSPYHHAALAALWGARVRPVSAAEIRAGGLARFDVLVMPGGGARAMAGLLEPLGDDGARAVDAWVRRGGMYVGSCAGSFLPARVGASFWRENPAAASMCMVDARLFNAGDGISAGLTSPGVGTIEAAPTRPSHWLARGLPPRFHLVHYNGPMFDPSWTGDDPRLGEAVGVARFAGATDDFTPGEGFMAPPPSPTLFDRGVAAGCATALAADVDDGTVVLFGSHPEFGLGVLQLGWGEGVRLFANALAERSLRRGDAPPPPAAPGPATGADLGAVAAGFERVAERLVEVRALPFERVAAGGRLPSFLGRSPQRLWLEALDAAALAAAAGARQARAWHGAPVARDDVAVWLEHRPPPEQDVGFRGLLPLLEVIEARLVRAAELARSGAPCLAHAYDALDDHPYQLAASSYLSAAGLTASALLALSAFGTRLRAAPATDDEVMGILLA